MVLPILSLLVGVLLIVLGGVRLGSVRSKLPYMLLILVGAVIVILSVLRIIGITVG